MNAPKQGPVPSGFSVARGAERMGRTLKTDESSRTDAEMGAWLDTSR